MTTSAQPYGKLLDYEQYIDHQLNQTRAKIRMTDVGTACLILLAATLGVIFLEVLLDHLIGLPLWFRRLVLLAGIAGGGTFAVLRIALPLVRRVNGLYAAKTIEDADPTFKNSLISYLELRKRRKEISKSAMAAVEAKAVKDLTELEVDNVVNQRRMLQLVYLVAGIIVVFCLYYALTPKSILASVKRALLADVVRPTNTRLNNIRPGNDPEKSRVSAGMPVEFAVDVDAQGVRPKSIKLHYSVDGGKFFSVKEFEPGKNYYDSWTCEMKNVQQSMDYYLTGGDAESLRYHLEVLPAPMVTKVSVDLQFPEYTGVRPLTGIEGGAIEALEGTKVTVHAQTNQAARSATLEFSSGTPEPMTVSSSDPYTLFGSFRVKESGSYFIKFRTLEGQVNPEPVVYDIKSIPDRGPTAQFLAPIKDTVELAANAKVLLKWTANDDHGVREILLHVYQGSESLQPASNLLEAGRTPKDLQQSQMLDIEKFRVKPGSEIQYWLSVKDNKAPTSNKYETPRRLIKVIAPATPEEKKKDDARVKSDADQAHDEEQNRAAEAGSEPDEKEFKPGDQGATEPDRKNGGENGDEQANTNPPTREAGKRDGGADSGKVDDSVPQPMTPEDQKTFKKFQDLAEKKNRPLRASDTGAPQQGNNPPPQGDRQQAANQNKANAPENSGDTGADNANSNRPRPNIDQEANSQPPPPPNGGQNGNSGSAQVERANPQGANAPNTNPQNGNQTPQRAMDRSQQSSSSAVQRGQQGTNNGNPSEAGQPNTANQTGENNPPNNANQPNGGANQNNPQANRNAPPTKPTEAGKQAGPRGANAGGDASKGAQNAPGEKQGPRNSDQQAAQNGPGEKQEPRKPEPQKDNANANNAPQNGENAGGANAQSGTNPQGRADAAGSNGQQGMKSGSRPGGEQNANAGKPEKPGDQNPRKPEGQRAAKQAGCRRKRQRTRP